MSLHGPFETCRTAQNMSVHRGRPEVTGGRSERRECPLLDEALREAGLLGKGWWQPGRLPTTHSLTGRLVRATKLTCLLTNFHDFVLRPETLELSIVEGTGCYHNARNRRCCTGVRHIEDHQHAGAIGSRAIHRDQFAAGSFDQVFGRFVATGCGTIHDIVESLRRVLSR